MIDRIRYHLDLLRADLWYATLTLAQRARMWAPMPLPPFPAAEVEALTMTARRACAFAAADAGAWRDGFRAMVVAARAGDAAGAGAGAARGDGAGSDGTPRA